ncbi:MAG: c-type cytochrome [Nitrospiria bacterium]
MKNKLIMAFVIIVLSPGVASAWPWSFDMFYQPSHRAQKVPAFPTPEGTVPIGGKPFFAKNKQEADALKNPMVPTSESISRGKKRFEIFCEVCHGSEGKGDGPVGKKFVRPADLTLPYIQQKTDGYIFYTIEHGGLFIMPSYGDSIPPEDRWHIINYIKTVLGGGTRATQGSKQK